MINCQKYIAIIPARGGSKGLPGKNIKVINGKPLIAWTIEQAFESKYLDKVFVSTDSQEIVSIAEKFGCEVPCLRPAELAQDSSPTAEAVNHTLDYFESNGETFDYIILLEPTSPLRKRDDIDRALEMLSHNTSADGMISMGEVHLEHPSIIKKIEDGFLRPYVTQEIKFYQRQQLDKAFFPYGVFYIIKVDVFKSIQTFYSDKIMPYFIERWQNYEIDDEIDFFIIEMLMKKYGEIIYG